MLGNECFPAVPPLPGHITTTDQGGGDVASPTPHTFSDAAAPLSPLFADDARASLPNKITKKRKSVAVHDDNDNDAAAFHPTATATASDIDLSDADPILSDASPLPARHPSLKRAKRDASKRLKRTSSRLQRKVSRSSVREEAEEKVVVVKPGGAVPPVPVVPRDIEGKKVKVVGDDGYGGLGHEIF